MINHKLYNKILIVTIIYELYDTKASLITKKNIKIIDGHYVENIDLDLLPGVYFLKITSDSKVLTKKVIIK